MKNHLAVAETFYSIQGEGPSTGMPSVFLRLGGCNLFCNSKDWRCDTIEVWQHSRSVKFEDVLKREYIAELQMGAHLVITGGEPLLQQEALADYLDWLSSLFPIDQFFVEVETNGTITPNVGLMKYHVDCWNISPKLPNSGEPFDKRVNEIALQAMINHGYDYILKFVISSKEDLMDLFSDYDFLFLNGDTRKHFGKLMFMPAGATQEELAVTRPIVVELCKQLNIRYTDRQHIVIWNRKTGV